LVNDGILLGFIKSVNGAFSSEGSGALLDEDFGAPLTTILTVSGSSGSSTTVVILALAEE